MEDGTCPKCDSQNVYHKQVAYGESGGLQVSCFSVARVEHYICASCGYVEAYLRLSDMKKITKHCKKVMPR